MLNTTQCLPKKLFILVRRDLSCGQQAVQACHALAELMRKRWNDP